MAGEQFPRDVAGMPTRHMMLRRGRTRWRVDGDPPREVRGNRTASGGAQLLGATARKTSEGSRWLQSYT
jgi:hypothetical protein